MTTYGGAWKRLTLPVSRVPLKPGIDPAHANPVDAPDPNAQDHTGAPLLPVEWSSGQYLQDNVASAYVDETPVSHDAPLGALPGVDRETAQQLAAEARSIDLGAFDARHFDRPRYQEDGSGHTVQVSPDLEGDSPETLKYKEKGVGVGIDPYARSNTAIHHFPTGPALIDMHWWTEEMRPRYAHNARGSTPRDVVAGRQENTSPEGAGRVLRPDNWAAPVMRRSAPAWDQAFASDAQEPPSEGNFGMGSWGL